VQHEGQEEQPVGQGAQATRRAIVDAALARFVEHGYVAASVDAIAEAAGVSRATVFTTFGTKSALLKAAYDAAFGGGDERTPLIQRPEAQPVLAERDPDRYLAAYMGLITDLFARVAPIYEVVRAAAAADPEVMPIWEAVGRERLNGSRRIVGHLVERGGLRPGLDPTKTADAIWVLNDPGLYHLLVHERGWPPSRYRSWLTDLLRRELLRAPDWTGGTA
jgi:AcrR family transcriptional regulator